MSDIPEEIRKMFPDQPIHKIDIDNDGKLQILASSEPLSNEPDFENMPIEQVNQYLRDHGYDPEQVGLRGKILTDALIDNIHLRERAEAAEREVAKANQRADLADAASTLALVENSKTIKQLNDAERELAALKERTRWIPVSERLPENGQRVYAQEYSGNITMFLYQSNLRLIFMRHYTHWQLLPLPEPPEAE